MAVFGEHHLPHRELIRRHIRDGDIPWRITWLTPELDSRRGVMALGLNPSGCRYCLGEIINSSGSQSPAQYNGRIDLVSTSWDACGNSERPLCD